MIKVNDDLIVNPMHVASITWDRGHSYTAMTIHMVDGTKHSVRHNPSPYGGTDCYKAEALIAAGFDKAVASVERLA